MIKRRKHKKMGLREETRVRCPGHLAFVRSHVCAIKDKWPILRAPSFGGSPQHECSDDIEAAHYRGSQDGGTGIKPGDNWAIPLCSVAHDLQHRIGESAFQKRFQIDMGKIAADLWTRSPHRLKLEKKRHED